MSATFNPQISISSAIGITGFLRMKLFEASSPNAMVAISPAYPPPHATSQQIQFIGLNPVIHIAQLIETANSGDTNGTVLANFSLDPAFPTVEVRTDLFIYGGVNAGFDIGDNKYVDPTNSLDGWDYTLEVQSTTIDPALEYSVDVNNNPTITDGTNLAGGATYQIFDNEKWVFHFKPKMIVYSPTASLASAFIVTELIDADITLSSLDTGKNFIVAGASPTLTITLPDLASITENKQMFFMSTGGNHLNVKFVCQGADEIDYIVSRSSITLGQGENLIIYKWSGKFRVSNDLIGVREVGEFASAYEANKPNRLHCNGTLISRTIYSRLFEYISSSLDPSLLISDTAWSFGEDATKGYFSLGDGSTTFRLPMLYDVMKGAGGLRAAGSFEDWAIAQHKHEETIGTLPNTLFGTGVTRLKGNYGGTSNQLTDLTGGVYGVQSSNIGDKTLVRSYAAYMCIKI